MRGFSCLSLLLVVSWLGCGDDVMAPHDDLGQDLSAAQDLLAPDLATGCTSLQLGGAQLVTPNLSMGAVPTETGGTIADGTYYLTAGTIYASNFDMAPAATPFRQAMRLGSGRFERVGGLASPLIAFAGTYSAGGNTLSLTATCGNSGGGTYSYTATATSLELLVQQAGYSVAQVFTKQ